MYFVIPKQTTSRFLMYNPRVSGGGALPLGVMANTACECPFFHYSGYVLARHRKWERYVKTFRLESQHFTLFRKTYPSKMVMISFSFIL